VAVYLTDAEYTGEDLDADTWQATLHIEVFLPARYLIPNLMSGWKPGLPGNLRHLRAEWTDYRDGAAGL
jgi:hypothetical protein